MTLRPEPYEQFVDDGVFDALDRLRAEADALGVSMAALAFAWVLACGRRRGVRAESRRRSSTRSSRRATSTLSPADRDRVGSFFA